ncbi:hypothetical protein BD414DRAFT_499257 [Trametes punicea]|nr:hypothetical protein BD414DRAFT_499257 [Trametes punicea]
MCVQILSRCPYTYRSTLLPSPSYSPAPRVMRACVRACTRGAHSSLEEALLSLTQPATRWRTDMAATSVSSFPKK